MDYPAIMAAWQAVHILTALWAVIAISLQATIYRRALRLTGEQAWLTCLFADLIGFAGSGLLAALVRTFTGRLRSNSSGALLLELATFAVATALEVLVVVRFNARCPDRRRLYRVAVVVNAVTNAVPIVAVRVIGAFMG